MINASIRAFLNALDTHPIVTLVATVGATTTVGAILYNAMDVIQQQPPTNIKKRNDSYLRDGTRPTDNEGIDNNNDQNKIHSGEHRTKGYPMTTTIATAPTTTTTNTKTIPELTLEQARVLAMIENAQASTWRENINNATVAQERFMLPGRTPRDEQGQNVVPEFMKKIEARAVELVLQNEYQREQEQERSKKRKITSKMW